MIYGSAMSKKGQDHALHSARNCYLLLCGEEYASSNSKILDYMLKLTQNCLVGALLLVTTNCWAAEWWSARPAWWSENTTNLLDRVEEAPRLRLEFSDVVIRPTTEGAQFGSISSVAIGLDGLFYLLQRNLERHPVVVLDAEGKIVRQWGKGRYEIPHSIRVDPDGNIWTVDSGNSQLYKYSPEGKTLLHIDVGEMPEAPHPFTGTSDIGFGSNGDLYIADGYGNSRVLVYDAKGNRIRQFGAPGREPGQFSLVHGLVVDDRDRVYVADRENGRIQKFDSSGTHLATWDGLGRVYSLQISDGVLWAVTQRLDHPYTAAGWLVQLDPESGEILGVISTSGTHSVTVRNQCEVTMGVDPNRMILYRPWPGVDCDLLAEKH